MTEEMKQKIMAKVAEETKDMISYKKLADECDAEGLACEAEIMRGIAAEEKTHHEWLKEILA